MQQSIRDRMKQRIGQKRRAPSCPNYRWLLVVLNCGAVLCGLGMTVGVIGLLGGNGHERIFLACFVLASLVGGMWCVCFAAVIHLLSYIARKLESDTPTPPPATAR